MKIHTETLEFNTEGWQVFVNITDMIKKVVKDSNIKEGFVNIYTTHTTSCIKIMEHETMLIKDLEAFIERIAPKSVTYYHDDLSKREVPPHERINGHSHLKNFVGKTSEYIPISNNEMLLGEWQKIFFLEYDAGRKRKVIVQVIGNEQETLY